ncbi:transcriptional regulator [Burkholderia latens]|uniref:Transcriptional regulator n=2 Tax=Burkholderia latens TaxID=488446 RepID=A0A6H9SWC8_9BURK|nr:transcriptional regulator [Burkholderia latens]KAB0637234.1 transcriptional regulator [Burkholderia latens]
MSDQDVKTYAAQVKRAPAAASNAVTAKPVRHTVRATPNVTAAAHVGARPESKAPSAPSKAKAPKAQPAAGAAAKVHVAAKRTATQVARVSTTVQH